MVAVRFSHVCDEHMNVLMFVVYVQYECVNNYLYVCLFVCVYV